MLLDSFNRNHNYLRISLTDVCNFRCTYCMPTEDMRFMPKEHLMQADEILEISKTFVNLGVKKIRLTGGEPLVRKDAEKIILSLAKLPVELTLTTNGARVHEFIDVFKEAGIKSLNISLDTLNKSKFLNITQRNMFEQVWDNIHLLIEKGFHVKVNAVAMKDFNHDEINDFIAWTQWLPVHVRFIEFMPFTGNLWKDKKVMSLKDILEIVSQKYSFSKLVDEKHDTAKKFQVDNHIGTFAIISTMSAPFCSNCNRMRLTADGKMKNCLFSKSEADILGTLRKGEEITPIIKQCLMDKKEGLGGQFTSDYEDLDAKKIHNRSMISIGG